MPFDLNAIPKEKPNDFSSLKLEDGLHEVTIEKVEYKQSSSGAWMLSLQLKAENGKFIFDQIMDDQTKPLNAYKLSRLITALGLTVTGSIELRDLTKVIKLKTRVIVSTVTKGDYVNVDILKSDGYYPLTPTMGTPASETPTAPINLQAAVDDDSF